MEGCGGRGAAAPRTFKVTPMVRDVIDMGIRKDG